MLISLKKTVFVRSLIPSAAREILIAGRIIAMNNNTGRRVCLEPELKLSVGKTNELLVEFQLKIRRVPLHVEAICYTFNSFISFFSIPCRNRSSPTESGAQILQGILICFWNKPTVSLKNGF